MSTPPGNPRTKPAARLHARLARAGGLLPAAALALLFALRVAFAMGVDGCGNHASSGNSCSLTNAASCPSGELCCQEAAIPVCTAESASNCGVCGKVCPSGQCVSGVCTTCTGAGTTENGDGCLDASSCCSGICCNNLCSATACTVAAPALCKECHANGDCPTGLACYGKICTATCSASVPCATGSACVNGFCNCKENPGGSAIVQAQSAAGAAPARATRNSSGGSASFQAIFPVLTSGGYTRTATTPQSECTALVYVGGPEVDSNISAGTLTLSNGGTVLATISPSATDNSYAGSFTVTPYWSIAGGESLTFAGAGGAGVAAFSAVLTAPATGTLTAPVVAVGNPPSLDVPVASPMTFSWTGGGSGVLYVDFYGGDGVTELICVFPSSAGSGTISAASLGTLGLGMGSVGVNFLSSSFVTAGTTQVNLVAETAPLSANATPWTSLGCTIH